MLDYLLILCLYGAMDLEAIKGKAPNIGCWVCGNNHHSLKYEINRYNVVKCNSCGFVYVNPPPDPAVLEKIYTKEYFKNRPLIPWTLRAIMATISISRIR